MSAAEALRRCPEAVFVRPDMALYREWSARVWDLVRELSPAVEVLGLDEGYLELPDDGRGRGRRRRAAGGRRARAALLLAGRRDLQGGRQGRLRPRQARRRHRGGARRGGRLPRAAAAAGAAGRRPAHRGAPGARPASPRSATWPRSTTTPCAGSCPGRFGEDLRRRARGHRPAPGRRGAGRAHLRLGRDHLRARRLRPGAARVGRARRWPRRSPRRCAAAAGPARTVTVKLRYADFQTDHPRPDRRRGASTTPRRSGRRPRRCSRGRCGERPGALRLLGVGVSGLRPDRQLTLF